MRENSFKQWKLKLHEKIKHNEKGCHAENLAIIEEEVELCLKSYISDTQKEITNQSE